MRRRRVRLTPFGYLVVAIFILLVLGGMYLALRSIGGSDDPAATPTPPLAQNVPNDPTATNVPINVPDTSTPTPTFTPEPTATPVPTPDPTPMPTATPSAARTPSPSEVEKALDGKLTTGGVVLRAAPNTDGAILGKYVSGTNLKVYGESGDYYHVQVVKEELYGYMAKKFVEVANATPEPIATSLPTGAVGGKVRSSKIALRSAPDLTDSSNKVGQVENGEPVYIYYQYTNELGEKFYYIEVARTGKKAFAFAEYITPEGEVPKGTP